VEEDAKVSECKRSITPPSPRKGVKRGERTCSLLAYTPGLKEQQPCFYCYTCGLTGQGICEACATQCHVGHVVRGPFGAFGFRCECGLLTKRSSPNNAVILGGQLCCSFSEFCSFSTTGKVMRLQPFYQCKTCNHSRERSICMTCAISCHAGHEVTFVTIAPMYCDCGSGLDTRPCRCMPTAPMLASRRLAAFAERATKAGHPLCTVLLESDAVPLQPAFECLTCALYGGICKTCADECHHGHHVRPLSAERDGNAAGLAHFVCQCGAMVPVLPNGGPATAARPCLIGDADATVSYSVSGNPDVIPAAPRDGQTPPWDPWLLSPPPVLCRCIPLSLAALENDTSAPRAVAVVAVASAAPVVLSAQGVADVADAAPADSQRCAKGKRLRPAWHCLTCEAALACAVPQPSASADTARVRGTSPAFVATGAVAADDADGALPPLPSRLGPVCAACARHCHAGHEVVYKELATFECGCGSSRMCSYFQSERLGFSRALVRGALVCIHPQLRKVRPCEQANYD